MRLSDAVERMREGLEIFGRYVSKDLVRQIMRSPQSTGVGGDAPRRHGDVHRHRRLLADQREHRAGAADQPPVALLRGAGRGDLRQSRHDRQVYRRQHHGVLERARTDPDHVANACRAALQAAAASRALGRQVAAASAARASAPGSACTPARPSSAMSARASASTTRWSAPSPTRRRGWKG